MGSKQTKIKETPETPQILKDISANPVTELQKPIIVPTHFGSDNLDPRSPNEYRTPIHNALYTRSATTAQNQIEVPQQQTPSNKYGDHPLGLLRKRFLRGFSYLHDPRSPSSQVIRTPLVFDENDKTLNLDDTFSDLFVESKTPAVPNTTVENVNAGQMLIEEAEAVMEIPLDSKRFSENGFSSLIKNIDKSFEASSFCYEEEETMPCPSMLQQTPNGMHQQLDPRSPTSGVERTPIIFTDDDEAAEDAMLENILATLSMDLSTGSSIASCGSPVFAQEEKIDDASPTVQLMNLSKKPTNKHLERVCVAKKRALMRKAITRSQRNRIYEDNENMSPYNNTARTIDTRKPKVQSSPLTPLSSISSSVNKRTPLSCVKNRQHLRSRSVESSAKSLKARLSITSFDDNFNPLQNPKVANLRIMKGCSKDEI